MLRRSGLMWCAAAAAGGATTTTTHSFMKRFEELSSNPESPLSGAEYAFMRERLAEYRDLQQDYAVKQTEVERARKAANMCGLEFTGSKPRVNPTPKVE